MTMLLLWIPGLGASNLSDAPASRAFVQSSALMRLCVRPLNPDVCQFLILTGVNPGKTGLFDTVCVRDYTVETCPNMRGWGSDWPLFDAMRDNGLSVDLRKVSWCEALDIIRRRAFHADVIVLKADAGDRDSASSLPALIACLSNLAAGGCAVALLSDFCWGSCRGTVNINNLLVQFDLMKTETGSQGSVEWEHTLAYHAGHGQLWVNLQGREPRGVVRPGLEYEEVREALVQHLPRQLLAPDGRHLVEKVWRKEELFSGEFAVRAPDLVVDLMPGYKHSTASTQLGMDAETVSLEPGERCPWPEGLLLLNGDGVARGVFHEIPAVDVAANILCVLGIPRPHAIEGVPLREAFAPRQVQSWIDSAKRPGPTWATAFSTDDEADIMARLRSLGYVG